MSIQKRGTQNKINRKSKRFVSMRARQLGKLIIEIDHSFLTQLSEVGDNYIHVYGHLFKKHNLNYVHRAGKYNEKYANTGVKLANLNHFKNRFAPLPESMKDGYFGPCILSSIRSVVSPQ